MFYYLPPERLCFPPFVGLSISVCNNQDYSKVRAVSVKHYVLDFGNNPGPNSGFCFQSHRE